ncbi:MAG: LptF/LptG family permease, partial [Pseudomonadota bacterium]|nr:LptF/LptG family permease [Pseudomonadota bacterium]
MSLLDLYIGRTIVHQALVVMAVLVGLFALVIFIDQIDDIGSGDYGVMRAFVFVGLSVPRIVYEVFPMAVLLGAILGSTAALEMFRVAAMERRLEAERELIAANEELKIHEAELQDSTDR